MSKYSKYNLKPGHFWANVYNELDSNNKHKSIVVDKLEGRAVIAVCQDTEPEYFNGELYGCIDYKNHEVIESKTLEAKDLAGCWLEFNKDHTEQIIVLSGTYVSTVNRSSLSIADLIEMDARWCKTADGTFSSNYKVIR